MFWDLIWQIALALWAVHVLYCVWFIIVASIGAEFEKEFLFDLFEYIIIVPLIISFSCFIPGFALNIKRYITNTRHKHWVKEKQRAKERLFKVCYFLPLIFLCGIFFL